MPPVKQQSSNNPAKPLTPIASETTRTQLTIEAVQYAGGYVAMKLVNAVEYVESLSNMGCSGQESSFHEYAMEWITSIDRGGLFYMSDTTLNFFKAIEIKTQELIPQHLSARSHQQLSKNDMLKCITQAGGVCQPLIYLVMMLQLSF